MANPTRTRSALPARILVSISNTSPGLPIGAHGWEANISPSPISRRPPISPSSIIWVIFPGSATPKPRTGMPGSNRGRASVRYWPIIFPARRRRPTTPIWIFDAARCADPSGRRLVQMLQVRGRCRGGRRAGTERHGLLPVGPRARDIVAEPPNDAALEIGFGVRRLQADRFGNVLAGEIEALHQAIGTRPERQDVSTIAGQIMSLVE